LLSGDGRFDRETMGFALKVRSDSTLTLYLEAGWTLQAALSNFLSASVEQGQLFRIEFLGGQKLL
jgi:hypothetical protein